MGPAGDVAVLTPARRGARAPVDEAAELTARLRVDVGGYGRRVRLGPAVDAEELPDACAGLEGAVLLGFDDDALERLPRIEVPVVAVDSYARDAWFPIVRSDDAEGGRRAAAHLLALGHRRIAFAASADERSRLVDERRRGFELALAGAGVRMLSLSAPDPLELGRDLVRRHDRPTAVLAADAALATELVAGLRERGARVPADISIMCFDGLARPAPGQPRLSGVAHDAARRSRLTADALFGTPASATLTVGVVVVDRASVGVPRAPRRSDATAAWVRRKI
jgi:LacI family transcriptional regulator